LTEECRVSSLHGSNEGRGRLKKDCCDSIERLRLRLRLRLEEKE
jgi:hypothetical protein